MPHATNLTWQQAEQGVWIGESPTVGPTLAIMGGVHGNEHAGTEVIQRSKNDLAIESGRIILIHGNPVATEQDVRYTEANMNRSFRALTDEELNTDPEKLPYEVRRAQLLLPFLDEADALLDIHQYTDPRGKPFIICEPDSIRTAREIGAPVISMGWSKTEPGGSDGYMHEDGAEAICYEVGSRSYHKDSVRIGRDVVDRFLAAHALTDAELAPLHDNPMYVQNESAHIRTGATFALTRGFVNFEPLKAGEPIAVEDDQTIAAGSGKVIIFPEHTPAIGEEAFSIGRIVSDPETAEAELIIQN